MYYETVSTGFYLPQDSTLYSQSSQCHCFRDYGGVSVFGSFKSFFETECKYVTIQRYVNICHHTTPLQNCVVVIIVSKSVANTGFANDLPTHSLYICIFLMYS